MHFDHRHTRISRCVLFIKYNESDHLDARGAIAETRMNKGDARHGTKTR